MQDFNSEPIGSKYMQPHKESVTKQQAYMVHWNMAYGHPLLKLSLSKLGWLVEAVPPWWCAASHRYIALYLHSINAPRLAAIQRMGWALKIWKGFFVHPQRAVPFWERCSMFCDSIWQWYPSAPCGAPVSAETHPVQLSSLQLFVKERVKHLAPACSLILFPSASSEWLFCFETF